jgi:predicted nuclease of restriction endonuclease-like RecB superfamily
MLTSDQSIVEYKAGRAIADRLTQSTHRHYVKYAEDMLAIYRDGQGRQRRQLHREIESLFADEPECPVRRIQAFCKLMDDRSIFRSDPDGKAAKLRLDVFSRVAHFHPLVEKPDQLFEHDEKGLYADVMSFQQLEQFMDYPNALSLLSRYNVAQLQACLYRAERMTIVATDDLKTILRYAKLAKLLHDIVRLGPSKYRITFSGPASVLHQTRRYGVNYAKFLPALLACKGWRMTAILKTPWNTSATLNLSDDDGFTSHLPPPDEYDSSLEESLAGKFGPERDGWKLIREGQILHNHQKTFVPDFTFRHEDGTEILLEIVGFWTPEYLAHKRQTLQLFCHHKILIAVPDKSLREGARIGKNVLVYKTTLNLKSLMEALERIRTENGL